MILILAVFICTHLNGQKPNIIIILADDLGYADLGVQGCKDIPTPAINSLAENGVVFSNAYASAPQCSPSRAGLLTGRYQQRFGHEYNINNTDDSSGLSIKEKLMGEYLQPFGYHTGMVGKWHLGVASQFHPLRRGFDEFWGFLGGGHDYFKTLPGTKASDFLSEIQKWEKTGTFTGYLTDRIGESACDFIDRNGNRPFFLYVSFNAPHGPLQAPDNYLQRVSRIEDPMRKIYGAMVVGMDDAIGNIINKLKELNIEENTLIFFLSDNGGPVKRTHASNAPLRGAKGDTYEGGVRVPFIVQWKASLPKNIVYEKPVISLDILPTIIAAAGETMPENAHADGVNLLPYISGDQLQGVPHAVLYHRFFYRTSEWSIRQGDWKLVVSSDRVKTGEDDLLLPQKPELYNLKSDIGETNNLALKQPEIVRSLEKEWNNWNKTLLKPAWGY